MQKPGHGIRLRSSARTSIGQIRENNEDNIHLWSRDDFVLAVVADGMGGAAAGEEASRIAVEAIQVGLALREQPSPDTLEAMGDDTITERLRDTIQGANRSIMQMAATAPEFRGMGTTVTLAFVRGTYAIVAHVGDSRAYLVDGENGQINQITSDHSFVEALLAAGHITKEQALDHPMRNVLYRALGQAEDVDIDLYYQHLHVGDRMVLCSDGLTRHVHPEEIAGLALADPNPDVVSQKLIDLANARGGEDNVSVIVISVEEQKPGGGVQREAMMADYHDDDETLVLKDRRVLRQAANPDRDSAPRNSATTPASHNDNAAAAPPALTDPLAADTKMMAERLKDSPPTDDLGTERGWADDVIPWGGDLIIEGLSDAWDTPTEQPVENLGEGRDTLMPEQ